MVEAIATATELQNNFGKYLSIVIKGGEVIVTKNGKPVGRFVPQESAVSYLTDSLTGIIKNENTESAKDDYMKEKYDLIY